MVPITSIGMAELAASGEPRRKDGSSGVINYRRINVIIIKFSKRVISFICTKSFG